MAGLEAGEAEAGRNPAAWLTGGEGPRVEEQEGSLGYLGEDSVRAELDGGGLSVASKGDGCGSTALINPAQVR